LALSLINAEATATDWLDHRLQFIAPLSRARLGGCPLWVKTGHKRHVRVRSALFSKPGGNDVS
jgi:hypothetical protein